MATTAVQHEVLAMEKRFWEATNKRDAAALKALTGTEYLMTMGEGITQMPGKEFVDMMVSDDFKLRNYKIDESSVAVSQPRDDLAIIGYKAHMEYEREGKSGKQDSYYSSTWLRDGGSWKCVAGSEARIIA